MIQSTIKEETKKYPLPFPKLMVNKKLGLVILVEKADDLFAKGVCVSSGMTIHPIGKRLKNWDAKRLEDFYGTIELTQTK